MDLAQAAECTSHLWCYAPFVNRYLVNLEVKDWPDPWELVYENHYCDLAKALAMLYTLYLSDHRPSLELQIFRDQNTGGKFNLVFVDGGKYVLNYRYDEVVNREQISENLVLERIITIQDLRLDHLQ